MVRAVKHVLICWQINNHDATHTQHTLHIVTCYLHNSKVHLCPVFFSDRPAEVCSVNMMHITYLIQTVLMIAFLSVPSWKYALSATSNKIIRDVVQALIYSRKFM